MTRERIKQIDQESGVSVVPVIRLFPVDPMRIQTTIGSAKKLASFAEEKFGVGALSISDSKSKKRTRKKRSHFATIAFQQLKCQTDKLSALNFFAVQTHRIWYRGIP